MRVRLALVIAVLGLMAAPAAASADFVHVVGPGESLSSIAAADGLSVGELAAANGLAPDAQLISGMDLQIPPVSGGEAAPPGAATATAGEGEGDGDDSASGPAASTDGDGDADDLASGAASAAASAAAGPSAGTYVVAPGDTLSGIAARAGLPVDALAAANGLDPAAPLLAGTVLRLSGAAAPAATPVSAQLSPASAAVSQPVGAAAEGSPVNPPYPTPETVSPSQVAAIAAANGVPPALADAIAYQESGFNNAAVSTADARGVMQILPGTWNWIQQTLVPGASPLAPASALDNVRGGVLLLHSLLAATGGNPALAAAGYYQGLPSVEQNGIYPSTQRYVNDVMALEQRFAGGG